LLNFKWIKLDRFEGFNVNKKLLIVDRNNDFRDTLKDYLITQKLNVEIYEADSQDSALKVALRERPEIVLLEQQLTQMDGRKISKLLKNIVPDSIIVIMSIFDGEKFQKKFTDEQIDHFIGKNEFNGKLIHVLKKYLAHSQ